VLAKQKTKAGNGTNPRGSWSYVVIGQQKESHDGMVDGEIKFK
jgi:hypothetical protein